MEADAPACGNCGETEGLLRCSRCRNEFFCSLKCQRAYWPFHKSACRRNEFADAVEETEPKFAGWMREHGKLAVLKDDEVDRLERAAAATTGPSRDDVMQTMYNRLEPKPIGPTYSAEDQIRMRHRQEHDHREALLLTGADKSWQAIELAPNMGLECSQYKWQQDQSTVDVWCRLPAHADISKVQVDLTPTHLDIRVDGNQILGGKLYAGIKREDSIWLLEDGLLHVSMLKRNRKGHYANGCTNADTFWFSLLQGRGSAERLPLQHPPTAYYHLDAAACTISGESHTQQMLIGAS